MTQKSYLWTGTATGDASLAPYSAAEFNRWFLTAHGLGHEQRFYIVPGYLDDLLIEPVAGSSYSSVIVRPGVVVFMNYVYVNDEDLYFNIDPLTSYPTTTYFRYDSIVLRLDRLAQTVTLEKLVGIESATFPPTAPTLTQTTNEVYELEVARVLVNSTAFIIEHADLQNKSRYLPIITRSILPPENLIRNHDFMAKSSVGLTLWPDSWSNVGVSGAESAVALPVLPQKRGYMWSLVNISTADYVYQRAPLPLATTGGANMLTYEGLFYLVNTTVEVRVGFQFLDKDDQYMPGKDIELGFKGAGAHIQRKTFRVPDGATSVFFRIYPTGTTNSFYIGKQYLASGYATGGFRADNYPQSYYYQPRDTSWDGDAKSTGTTAINFVTTFGGDVPYGAKGVIFEVAARDSGSAASSPFISVYNYSGSSFIGVLYLDGLPNDYVISRQFTTYIDEPYSTARTVANGITLNYTASGAGTLDIWVKIVGVIT